MSLRSSSKTAASLAAFGSLVFVLTVAVQAPAQEQPKTLKELALDEFKNAHYEAAIDYLKQALAGSAGDAELYYYLGYFTHYLCYDSVPLSGFDRRKSDEVLHYLEKAVEIDPHYGDALYFVGAEYGARARQEMWKGDAGRAAEEFRRGQKAGGYPDWMIEYGRNTLRSCGKGAILITGGDAETNPVEYLQCVDGYRIDVTVIPLSLLDRPWFIGLLERGATGMLTPAPISWTTEQIESMRPFKWKKTTLLIPVPEEVRGMYQTDNKLIEWEVSPNLGRGGEPPDLLSAGRAAFLDIVRTNEWKRPIHFATGCPPAAWEGLERYVQLYGFTERLVPFDPSTDLDVDFTKSILFDDKNFTSLPTLGRSDMPRVSGVLQNYRAVFFALAAHYADAGDAEGARTVLARMKKSVPENILPMPEGLKRNLESLESAVKAGG
jgi:tetratricopeptide (TPR) repeat protein